MDVKQLVKRASVVTDSVVHPPVGITVLIYHRVGGGSPSAVDLDADTFDAQLAHLAAHHRVITLEAALAELALPSGFGTEGARAQSTGPAVVITFDDGTADFCDVAVPILVRHALPATLYVATKFIDEVSAFPWGAPPTSWLALRDAASTGLVAIGSHTHSHWLLDRLDARTIDDDLDRSIDLIGTHIGVPPRDFAYPKAVPGSPVAEIAVRRRFRSASLATSRVNRPGHADAHRLWRTPIQRDDNAELFAAKAGGGLRLEGELRALAARVRYRRATR
ncbi:MAG TPA: polysaccharide deacetylase family protein [Ilumatobacteraceae bacterium]